MKKQMMICMAFICLATVVIAQNTTMTFLFPIMNINQHSGGFFVEKGIDFKPNTEGVIYGLYDANNRERNQVIGTVTVTESDEAGVYFDYEKTTDFIPGNGDLVAFELNIPNIGYYGVLYKMYALNITFEDVYDEKVYDDFSFYQKMSEADEKTLMNKLLAEIHFVGSAMKEQSETFPKISEKGRFGDTDIYSAMESANYEDLRSFLRYVAARPMKYQGKRWKISEIFATWVDSGTPCTTADISELLLISKDATTLKKYLANSSKETIEEATESWRNQAEELSKEGDFDDAFQLVEKSMKIGEITENQSIIAWSYYSKGYLFGQEENSKKSIEYYEKAKETFENNNDKIAVIVIGSNIGNALNAIEAYEQALEYLDDAYKAQSKLVKKNTENEVLNNVTALILKNQGDSYKGLEKYDKALNKYETALSHVENATLEKGLFRKISIYTSLSDLHLILGNEDLSESYSSKATDMLMEMIWSN